MRTHDAYIGRLIRRSAAPGRTRMCCDEAIAANPALQERLPHLANAPTESASNRSAPPARPDRPRRPKKRGLLSRLLAFVSGFMRLVVATAVFFGILVAASYFAIGYYIKGHEIAAPDLTARPIEEAMAIAREHDLSLKLEREEPSDMMTAGEILSQRPRPGTTIKAGSPIKVIISSGQRMILIPEQIVGEHRLQAGIRLRELGLKVGNVAFIPTSGKGDDVVLALDPPQGTSVPPDTVVNLLASAEAVGESFAMPDLYGLTPDSARAELARYGAIIATINSQEQFGVAPGTVHTQTPTAGTPTRGKARIEITIAPR